MDGTFDVAVIGAGINGTAICHALSVAGYRVLLTDQGDLGSGASQASAMLVLGGPLYPKSLETASVRASARERNQFVAARPGWLQPRSMLYIPAPGRRQGPLVLEALRTSWQLSAARQTRPRHLQRFEEQAALDIGGATAFVFEEVALGLSDARYVLTWALEAERLGAVVRNYLRVESFETPRPGTPWRVGVCDTLTGSTATVTARMVVNAAGCWTDAVNARADVTSPHRHTFSRRVSMAFARPRWHTRHLAFDTGGGGVMMLAPWGPVSLWGSTDTLHADPLVARRTSPRDAAALLRELNRHLRTGLCANDIISMRTAVGPVPMPRDAADSGRHGGRSPDHRVHLDLRRPWVSIHGGRFSGCVGLAAEVCRLVAQRVAPSAAPATAEQVATARLAAPELTSFPTLTEPVVSARWAATHEQCQGIGDYLRRRTNIAQWVPRGGFGADLEHADVIERLALDIHDDDTGRAGRDVLHYWHQVWDTEEVLSASVALEPEPVEDPSRTSHSSPPVVATSSRRRSATGRWRRE